MNFQELKQIALANPKGMIEKHNYRINAVAPNTQTAGPWDGSGTCRDILGDLGQTYLRLSGSPQKLIGSTKTLFRLCYPDYGGALPLWATMSPMFPHALDRIKETTSKDVALVLLCSLDFIEIDDSADDGLVIVTGSDGSAVLIDTR